MSDLNNSFKLLISSKRWIKKYFRGFLPEMAYVQVENDLKMYLSVKDVSGPSFDLAYDKSKAFYNYEITDKKMIEQYLKDGDVFLDVGANIGHFSFYFKHKFQNLTCHLFEPIPWLATCIKETIQNNSMTNMNLHQMALSNESKDTEFFIDTFNDGGHSLIAKKLSRRSKQGQSIKVKMETLDDFSEKVLKLNQLDFLKIDVQGAENFFIKGAKNTLMKFKPKMLIEVDGQESLNFWTFLEKELEMEFDVFSHRVAGPLDKEKIQSLMNDYKVENITDCNYLFVPKSA